MQKSQRLLEDNFAKHGLKRYHCTTVGVHMRRGDVADDTVIKRRGFIPATIDYLAKVVRFYEQQLLWNGNRGEIPASNCLAFVIFGEDYAWNMRAADQVRTHVGSNATHLIVIGPAMAHATVDLCALTLCDHVATSVGTYSWWAGYLNRGIVTYQKDYAVPGSLIHNAYEPNEIFLPGWIGL